jgi:hypothetical protein
MKDLIAKKMVVAPHWDPDAELNLIDIALPEDGEVMSENMFDNIELGEQLYQSYPPAFPLGEGRTFIARSGMPKHKLIELYLDKIGRDSEKHKFVMIQLEKYVNMVANGKINGHKLSDWVEQEMWDVIASISGETASQFKEDI